MEAQLIIAAVTAASQLISKGIEIMEARRRDHELTPEEEAAWDKALSENMAKPHWQPSKR